MKYLFVLFFGFCIGIGGELLIPRTLWTTVGAGCIKQTDDGLVFMPELIIYNPKLYPYPASFGGHAMTFVPSYRYAYALLTKELTYLNRDDCNSLVDKYLEGKRIENLPRKIKPRISHKPRPRPSSQ